MSIRKPTRFPTGQMDFRISEPFPKFHWTTHKIHQMTWYSFNSSFVCEIASDGFRFRGVSESSSSASHKSGGLVTCRGEAPHEHDFFGTRRFSFPPSTLLSTRHRVVVKWRPSVEHRVAAWITGYFVHEHQIRKCHFVYWR